MKFVLLVYHGPNPALPGSDRWKALPEAEQKAIYADTERVSSVTSRRGHHFLLVGKENAILPTCMKGSSRPRLKAGGRWENRRGRSQDLEVLDEPMSPRTVATCGSPSGLCEMRGDQRRDVIRPFARKQVLWSSNSNSFVIRPPLESGDPTENWPDIRLPPGTAAELIDADRGET